MQKKNVMLDLLINELRDLYSAECQLIEVLPRLARATSDENLKIYFLSNQDETKKQKERLETISNVIGIDINGIECAIIKDLIAEEEEISQAYEDTFLLNTALIAVALRIEHYEIAAYGASKNYADLLLEDEVSSILSVSLKEKKEADHKLYRLASKSMQIQEEAIL